MPKLLGAPFFPEKDLHIRGGLFALRMKAKG